MDETRRGKFEGGDADWEESRLGNYAGSELRLVEIQEKLCLNIDKAQDQCHSLAEKHESLIEEWWFKRKKDDPDLHTFLCINNLKGKNSIPLQTSICQTILEMTIFALVCCPPSHYGAECKPCKGGIENPCSGHGKCKVS